MSALSKSFLAALALCLVSFTGLVAGTAAAHTPTEPSTARVLPLPVIVDLAKGRATGQHPGAKFFGVEALFEPPIWDPNGVRFWSLNFYVEHDGRDGFSYIYTAYGEYVKTVDWDLPLGIEVVDDFSLDQFQARDIAREAGHTGVFTALYLAQPVVLNPEPIYYFCFDHQTVGVGAYSKDVFENLFPC